MSNLPAAVQSTAPLPAARALAPAVQGRVGSARVIPAESAAARPGASNGFKARPAQPEARGTGSDARPAAPGDALRDREGRGAGFAAATGFLAQVLGQAPDPEAESPLLRHRDGPSLGSQAYRRAGGEPPVYSEAPNLIRLSV